MNCKACNESVEDHTVDDSVHCLTILNMDIDTFAEEYDSVEDMTWYNKLAIYEALSK